MLWGSFGFLSATLRRQNFQVLAGCAPSLAEQAVGRLGRPLSEVPEFWRAAPEAALRWSAEEFEFPPSPWADPGVGAADGGDDTGAGQLGVAGIRL